MTGYECNQRGFVLFVQFEVHASSCVDVNTGNRSCSTALRQVQAGHAATATSQSLIFVAAKAKCFSAVGLGDCGQQGTVLNKLRSFFVYSKCFIFKLNLLSLVFSPCAFSHLQISALFYCLLSYCWCQLNICFKTKADTGNAIHCVCHGVTRALLAELFLNKNLQRQPDMGIFGIFSSEMSFSFAETTSAS